MKLLKFKVTNFRSVRDSGWIDTDQVTALIGENESGKSNLLLPLWKLNPAREGELQPTSDYPKALFNEIRANPGEHHFIEALFETGDAANEIARIAGVMPEAAKQIEVTRWYDGNYSIELPLCDLEKCVAAEIIRAPLEAVAAEADKVEPTEAEGPFFKDLKALIAELLKLAPKNGVLPFAIRATVRGKLLVFTGGDSAKAASGQPNAPSVIKSLQGIMAELAHGEPVNNQAVIDAAVAAMPKFVYYANYGNLDSEIYLPRAIDDLKRKDLGPKDAAKARTLRVLFKFVKLEPKEILELGS